MIVFDLHCEHGHRFEGWFGSSSDYEDQLERGLLTCPECGTSNVTKAPMAPAVPAKSNAIAKTGPEPAPAPPDSPGETTTPLSNREAPAEMQQAMAKLAEAQASALKNSTWVGKDFAEQSREMHYGERDEAAIHGSASLEEAKSLIDEGVPVTPLPFPVSPAGKLN